VITEKKNNFTVAILTISDKGSIGEREDTSYLELKKIVESHLGNVNRYDIVPDEKEQIKNKLIHYSDILKINLILTCGGTGFSKRDVTPEATLEVIEKRADGLSYKMYLENSKITPKTFLSRAVCGIRKNSLIINLPGSVKGSTESLTSLLDILHHGLNILLGNDTECGVPTNK
jgi:molybdenum cofactor synthesis domain-containing protein